MTFWEDLVSTCLCQHSCAAESPEDLDQQELRFLTDFVQVASVRLPAAPAAAAAAAAAASLLLRRKPRGSASCEQIKGPCPWPCQRRRQQYEAASVPPLYHSSWTPASTAC